MLAGDVGAVLFIDIDHFKYVNDNFGHRQGDQLIVGVSGVLKEAVKQFNGAGVPPGRRRVRGVPARSRCAATPTQVAEHLLEALRHYRFQASGQQRVSSLTASIGIALYPFHGSDVAGLLSNADIAMYQAKDSGPQPRRALRPGRAEPAPHAQPRAVGQQAARRARRRPPGALLPAGGAPGRPAHGALRDPGAPARRQRQPGAAEPVHRVRRVAGHGAGDRHARGRAPDRAPAPARAARREDPLLHQPVAGQHLRSALGAQVPQHAGQLRRQALAARVRDHRDRGDVATWTSPSSSSAS